MTLTIALTLNILLDIAIVGIVALVMSRANKPHTSSPGRPRTPLSQRSPMPLRHSSTYQTATTIRAPRVSPGEDRAGEKVSGQRDGDLRHQSS